METKEEVTLTILHDKRVEALVTTIYMLDNEELTRKNFRFVLNVGEYDKAKEYLNDYYISILEAVWI
jgi:hypothetical protein